MQTIFQTHEHKDNHLDYHLCPPPRKVTIDGCVFQSEAKVKIEAGKVEVIGKFTAELGSKVEMTQCVE